MIYTCIYKTPEAFSDIILTSDGENLTALYFETSKGAAKHPVDSAEENLAIFRETGHWLDLYFHGKNPDFMPKYKLANLTPFRQQVIDILRRIPFGKTVTYGDIAKRIAAENGLAKMSAQAVGGAVGWNPVCILIPCHRVVGANGNLTGYGGGIQNKIALLAHEKNDMAKYFLPK